MSFNPSASGFHQKSISPLKYQNGHLISCVFPGTLSSHPARKHVTDFLKHILTDSLSLSQSSKSPAVIDLILEVK